MDKNKYFSLMRETSDLVFPVIEARIDALKKEDAELHSIVRYVVDKRDKRLLLRPFLIRLAYELSGGPDWRKTISVGAAFELLNISSYQANSAFDSKHRILSPRQKNAQFVASMVTRELAVEVLNVARAELGDVAVNALMNDLSECNKNMYFAQHYDMNILIAENFEHYRNAQTFLAAYTKRCYLGCGIFTGLCARAGGLVANADATSLLALNRFGEQFGTALQITNDLADFVPPGSGPSVGRVCQDQFSDLLNGRMTLGCYKLFSSCGADGKTILKRVLAGETITEQEFAGIADLLVSEGIVGAIIETAIMHESMARKELDVFFDSLAKEYLDQMLTICHLNKFTKALSRVS